MTRERYFQWMRIWKWFATVRSIPQLGKLHELFNELWQDERKTSTAAELAAHSEAWALEDLDFANDPEYQAYMRERESGGSGKEPD